jgi:threonine dehydrogenase-like Zn-dependent dehydrogenase
MKAIVYQKSIPRYAVMKLAGPKRSARWATASHSPICPVRLRDIERPPLPSDEWIRVAPILTGVCGSDLSVVCAKGSPYFSPLTSTPFVLGHEIVGRVSELGERARQVEQDDGLEPLNVGDRIVIEPALGCRVRGIAPVCQACAAGAHALCRNVTRGAISAGIQTGYCRDTGGGWSSELVAHRTQLYKVPEDISDTAAVLAEPLACVLHGVLRARLREGQTALVMGCGAIGLLTIAAIRARGFTGRIAAVAKYTHQADHARRLGANVILSPPSGAIKETYAHWAEDLGAELHYPEIGKPTVLGGVDVVLECIGSSQSIDDAVRFTTSGGAVVLIGMPGVPSNVDWTGIWYKELSLYAAYAYGLEDRNGDRNAASEAQRLHTCEMALQMLQTTGPDLEPLVGAPFALEDYRIALRNALFTGRSKTIKTVFRISE